LFKIKEKSAGASNGSAFTFRSLFLVPRNEVRLKPLDTSATSWSLRADQDDGGRERAEQIEDEKETRPSASSSTTKPTSTGLATNPADSQLPVLWHSHIREVLL
jgi:hypothetical protein